jgi:hypothetical protein
MCVALHTKKMIGFPLFCKGFLVEYEQMFGIMDELKQAREALDAQAAAWVAIVGEYDRSEQWRADGYGSVEVAIADGCRMDRGVVSVDVKLARKLEQLPVVADAFAEGAISQRHAAVIATAATPERMAEFTNLETEFVDVARKCPPKELAGIVRYVTDALDGDGGADAEERIYQRRSRRHWTACSRPTGCSTRNRPGRRGGVADRGGTGPAGSGDADCEATQRGCVHDDHAPMA